MSGNRSTYYNNILKHPKMASIEANQMIQRLNSLRIVDTPPQRQHGQRECQSDVVKKTQVPATPCSGATTFQTQLKRRKMKLNRACSYETDKHFIRARKSLKF